jgi:DNA-binding transcriptional ArsR family regulator
MGEEAGTRFAAMLAALSQPTRLRIVAVLAAAGSGGMPAGQIARAVNCPASTLSFHLKELSEAGLLRADPEGRFIRYSTRPDAFAMLAGFISSLPGEAGTASGKSRGRRRGKGGARKPAPGSGGEREGQISMFGD